MRSGWPSPFRSAPPHIGCIGRDIPSGTISSRPVFGDGLLGVVIHFVIGRRGDGPSRCFHFVSGGLTNVGGMVGIDFDLQYFSVDAASSLQAAFEAEFVWQQLLRWRHSRRRRRAAKAAAWCSLTGWCRRCRRTSGATGTSTRHLVLVVMDLLSSTRVLTRRNYKPNGNKTVYDCDSTCQVRSGSQRGKASPCSSWAIGEDRCSRA